MHTAAPVSQTHSVIFEYLTTPTCAAAIEAFIASAVAYRNGATHMARGGVGLVDESRGGRHVKFLGSSGGKAGVGSPPFFRRNRFEEFKRQPPENIVRNRLRQRQVRVARKPRSAYVWRDFAVS